LGRVEDSELRLLALDLAIEVDKCQQSTHEVVERI
jgi:hypothetical protein